MRQINKKYMQISNYKTPLILNKCRHGPIEKTTNILHHATLTLLLHYIGKLPHNKVTITSRCFLSKTLSLVYAIPSLIFLI